MSEKPTVPTDRQGQAPSHLPMMKLFLMPNKNTNADAVSNIGTDTGDGLLPLMPIRARPRRVSTAFRPRARPLRGVATDGFDDAVRWADEVCEARRPGRNIPY